MSRWTRGLLALSSLVLLTWSVNLVIALEPSNQLIAQLPSANEQTPYQGETGLVMTGEGGLVIVSPAQALTGLSNAQIRENPDSASDGSALVPVAIGTTLIPASLSPATTRGDGPTRTSIGPIRTTSTLAGASTTRPRPATTTTRPHQTTTTRPAVTTTTRPAVTTTTRPAPATTASTVLAGIPATIPHPPISGDIGYLIGLSAKDPERGLWRAPYLYEVPYASNTGWLAGDRVGYGCAYGFLQQNGEIVGRFTFRRIEGATYIVVNDTYMDEGARYYDGSPTPPGTSQVPDFECPVTTESYEPSNAPDERPVIVYWSGAGQALEIRDYRTVVPGAGVTFEVIEVITQPFQVTSAASGTHTVNSRVTVLARENGVPVVVIYYDGLGSGQVTK